MALDKPYKNIPGTVIFDAEQSRKGYWLNQFCMSLMQPQNRERFRSDERAYLDEWDMTEDQKQAVLDRDLNHCHVVEALPVRLLSVILVSLACAPSGSVSITVIATSSFG